jgi:hypothetical protein
MPRTRRPATRTISLFTLVATLSLITPPAIRAQTPTQEIADCIDNAAQEFADCVNDHAWYVAPFCAAQYAADTILCIPSEVLPSSG